MKKEFFKKSYIFIFFLFYFSCIKYYDSHFNEEQIYSFPKDWKIVMANGQQVFINTMKELEIRFNRNEWCGAQYIFPYYFSNGTYKIDIYTRTQSAYGRVILYGLNKDCNNNVILFDKKINPSNVNQYLSFIVQMPGKDYHIVLLFTKYNMKARRGRFFINSVKIEYRLLNFRIRRQKFRKVDCSQVPSLAR